MPERPEAGRLASVHPVLPCRDVKAAVAFYVHRLGFKLAFIDNADDPRYAGVRRDAVVLHLQWHDEAEWDLIERPMLRIAVEELALLFEEFEPKKVFHEHSALRKTEWGTEEFAFYDADGNGLTFFRDLGEDE